MSESVGGRLERAQELREAVAIALDWANRTTLSHQVGQTKFELYSDRQSGEVRVKRLPDEEVILKAVGGDIRSYNNLLEGGLTQDLRGRFVDSVVRRFMQAREAEHWEEPQHGYKLSYQGEPMPSIAQVNLVPPGTNSGQILLFAFEQNGDRQIQINQVSSTDLQRFYSFATRFRELVQSQQTRTQGQQMQA